MKIKLPSGLRSFTIAATVGSFALVLGSRLWSQPTTGNIMTTAAVNYSWPGGATVERVELTPEGEMHIYYRQPSNTILTSNPPIVPPDSHWKAIYGVKDGKIVLLRRVDAKVTPATRETVEWPK